MLPLEITCEDVHSLQNAGDTFAFIDCREPDEFEMCRIMGATLLPMSELRERLAELEPHRGGRVVVHCHHGGRSLRVASFLRQQGFSQAQSMAGGIDAWSERIDPTVPRY
ncbi:MAG: rhodanese-like domain-containing protein [Planctomycetaceae bacterium]